MNYTVMAYTRRENRELESAMHLAAAGHPLLADALYGGAPALGIERQALHAHALRFAHPLLGHALRFEAPPPADFETAWRHIDPSLQPRP